MRLYRRIILVVLTAGVSLFLSFSSRGVFNTPDENANYFFSRNLIQNKQLTAFEPLEELVDNAVHPRGVNVVKGNLVPESFLGLPILYGGIGVAVGEGMDFLKAIPLMMALLTTVALFCLYKIFSAFFDKKISQLSLLLACLLPVFLYWSGRPFMHAILFADLIIIGWSMLIRQDKTNWDMLAGLIIGSAIAVRTSEIAWVLAITFLLIIRKKSKIPSFLKTGFGLGIILMSLLFLNQDLYGSFFGTGYSVTEANLAIDSNALVPQLASVSLLKQIFLPFGLDPIGSFERFIQFGLGVLWWYAAPMLLGLIILFWKRRKIENRYAIVWVIFSAYLILFYGSFNAEVFADPLHPLEQSIGAPHLRYWLPMFVFGLPFLSYFLTFFKNKAYVILIVILSLRAVVWNGPESWKAIGDNLLDFQSKRNQAVYATPENSIMIIPRWADRIYFPDRKVIVDMEDKDVVAIINTLFEKDYSVFWLRGRGEINLEGQGFKIERKFEIDPNGKIYEIKKS